MNSGKKVLVTGGSSGIGKGAVLEFAKAGYDVAFTYSRHEAEAQEIKKEITGKYGIQCAIYHASLEQEGAAEKLAEEALTGFGPFNVLFNNAGRTLYGALQECENETLDFMVALNYRMPIILSRLTARNMIENKIKGCILFNTSVRAKQSYPADGVYGGLKSALERGAQSFALDLARYGIRVNCVGPGIIVTEEREQHRQDMYNILAPRIPLKRLGRPADIGKACVWLASDEASYVTGQTLVVDGGLGLPGMPEYPFDDSKHGWSGPWYRDVKSQIPNFKSQTNNKK